MFSPNDNGHSQAALRFESAPTNPASGGTPMSQEESETERLKREIEELQLQLQATAGELQKRLSLSGLKNQMKATTRKKAGQAMNSVQTASQSLLNEAGAFAERHPGPSAIAGLGLGWALTRRVFGSSKKERATASLSNRWLSALGPAVLLGSGAGLLALELAESSDSPEYRRLKKDLKKKTRDFRRKLEDNLEGKAQEAYRKAEDLASDLQDSWEVRSRRTLDKIYALAENLQEEAREVAENMRGRATESRQQVTRQSRKAEESLSKVVGKRPLLLGAVAAGLGLAAGLWVQKSE